MYRDHIIAFARCLQDEWAITVAPRFYTALVKEGQLPLGQNVWQDTFIKMPNDIPVWKNEITNQQLEGGEEVLVGEVLEYFSVAILTGREDG
jgi:(1->4)-alpha-D-glucan 1-alpha-D-glucosylmutase